MKDAYGGTFMIGLFLVFFVIYFSIIGVALNFAKLYRIKNNVINILEQYEYNGQNDTNVHEKMEAYLKSVPYSLDKDISLDDDCDIGFTDLGVCIVQKGEEDKHYYSVTVYYYARLPVLNIYLPISAKGETIVIG